MPDEGYVAIGDYRTYMKKIWNSKYIVLHSETAYIKLYNIPVRSGNSSHVNISRLNIAYHNLTSKILAEWKTPSVYSFTKAFAKITFSKIFNFLISTFIISYIPI